MRFFSTVGVMLGISGALLTGMTGARAQITYPLYSAALGGKPGDQPWLKPGNTGGVETGPSAGSVFTKLVTTNAVSDGYSNYNLSLTPTLVNAGFPVLNRATGITLQFTMRENSVTTTFAGPGTTDPTRPRAGFSVIFLGSDSKGVEIGFQGDTLFTQAPGFLAPAALVSGSVNGVSISTLTSALTTYTLTITGDNYALSGGGTTLLSGTVQDYTGTTGLAGIPYRTPNYLFLGDDTSSAGANMDLAAVSVTVTAPEPGALSLVGISALGLMGFRLARRRAAPVATAGRLGEIDPDTLPA